MHYLALTDDPVAETKAKLDHHVGVATLAHMQADADPTRAHTFMTALYRDQLNPQALEALLVSALLELARRDLRNPGGTS